MKNAKILAILVVAVMLVSLLAAVEKPDDVPKGKGWNQVWDALVDLQAQIVQEIADRIADVDAEEAARIAADNTLQSNIDAEATARADADDALQGQIDSIQLLPSGVIVMWSGSIGDIPEDWALCDGTEGTPDLSNRFIYGASGGDVGNTGGSSFYSLTVANLPAHTHTGATNPKGAHSHSYDRAYFGGGTLNMAKAVQTTAAITPGRTHTAGSHYHSFTTHPTGSSRSIDNRPAYYKLAFIIKM